MAVKEIIPKESVKAVDIRDTLIDNGANWSSVIGNNSANHLPNYFKSQAKLNPWSRHKPINHESLLPLTYEQKEDVNWGIRIVPFSSLDSLVDTVLKGEDTWEYSRPIIGRNPLRLSDFCEYYAKARVPSIVVKTEQVDKGNALLGESVVTPFPVLFSNGGEYALGVDDIYGKPMEQLYGGVYLKFEDEDYWTTGEVDWVKAPLVRWEGDVTVINFITDMPLGDKEPPSPNQKFYPVVAKDVPYTCKVTNIEVQKDVPFEIAATVKVVGTNYEWVLYVIANRDYTYGGVVNFVDFKITNIDEDKVFASDYKGEFTIAKGEVNKFEGGSAAAKETGKWKLTVEGLDHGGALYRDVLTGFVLAPMPNINS